MSGKDITPGSTDQETVLRFLDSGGDPVDVDHSYAGLALWYRRNGGLKVAISPVALASLDAEHTDGGVEAIDDGYSRVDLPDEAVAVGSDGVTIGGSITDGVVIGNYHALRAANAGPGGRELTWITKRSGTPVTSAEAWITTDLSNDNVVGGTYLTDDSGVARVPGGVVLPMIDDDVEYYGWRDSTTHQFTNNPIRFRYSTLNSRLELWDGSAYQAWDGISDDAMLATISSSQTSVTTAAGALIKVNKSRGITKDLTIVKANGYTITPQSQDEIRVIIGREGRLGTDLSGAELVVASDAPTAAGSTFTKGGGGGPKNRLRLDASDLVFEAGVYTMWFEMFDYEDGEEWKLVTKHVFVLEE